MYVVGGSAMPTYSPSHPTLTIAALAIRAGEADRRALTALSRGGAVRAPSATGAAGRAAAEGQAGQQRVRDVLGDVALPRGPVVHAAADRLQARGDARRTPAQIVRVRGDVVHQAGLEQREGETLRALAERAGERRRGDRHRGAGRDEPADRARIVAEDATPFHVGEEHAEAPGVQVRDVLLDVAVGRRVALEQQHASAAEGMAAEPIVIEVAEPRLGDLGAGQELQRDALGAQQRAERRGSFAHDVRHRVEAEVDVWRGHQHARPRVRGGAGHGQRLAAGRRAVVQPREHVGVQVDHAPRSLVRGPRAPPRRTPPRPASGSRRGG